MIERFVRPSIQRLRAYESARSLAQQAEAFLDANEAPESAFGTLNRYPSPQPPDLVAALAGLYGVRAENLMVGRGSDEAIDLLTRCFCEPGRDEVVISRPTYGMYKVAADIQDCAVVDVPLKSGPGLAFALDVDALIARSRAAAGRAKLIYVCSPNNPTGNAWPFDAIARLCRETRETSLVVVDEAYAEFAPGGGFLAQALKVDVDPFATFPNLVVLRTLSKAWALAGARIGVALAAPEAICVLQKARAPYPLPQPAVEVALRALAPAAQAETRARVERIAGARTELVAGLRALPATVEIADAQANFVLVRFRDSARIMQAARAEGVILRDRGSEPGLAGCIRITVGTPVENAKVLQIVAGEAKA